MAEQNLLNNYQPGNPVGGGDILSEGPHVPAAVVRQSTGLGRIGGPFLVAALWRLGIRPLRPPEHIITLGKIGARSVMFAIVTEGYVLRYVKGSLVVTYTLVRRPYSVLPIVVEVFECFELNEMKNISWGETVTLMYSGAVLHNTGRSP